MAGRKAGRQTGRQMVGEVDGWWIDQVTGILVGGEGGGKRRAISAVLSCCL